MAGKKGVQGRKKKPVKETAKREELKRLDRRKIVWQLYTRRMTYRDIAAKLECAVGTVKNDIVAGKKLWKEEMLVTVDAVLERELAELDNLERFAWGQIEEALERKGLLWEQYHGRQMKDYLDLDYDQFKALIERRSWKESDITVWVDKILAIKQRRAKLLGLDTETVAVTEAQPVPLTWATPERMEEIRKAHKEGKDDGE